MFCFKKPYKGVNSDLKQFEINCDIEIQFQHLIFLVLPSFSKFCCCCLCVCLFFPCGTVYCRRQKNIAFKRRNGRTKRTLYFLIQAKISGDSSGISRPMQDYCCYDKQFIGISTDKVISISQNSLLTVDKVHRK